MPFTTVETVEFPAPVGKLEAFCTDGLASLVYTMKGMRELDEKTLRYPGHAEKMSLLQESGFFSKEPVKASSAEVSPLEVSWAVLGEKLSRGSDRDMTVMRVEAKSGDEMVAYDMVDSYDERDGVTSMGKTTGYTASIVAQMVGSGAIDGSGASTAQHGGVRNDFRTHRLSLIVIGWLTIAKLTPKFAPRYCV